MALFKTFRGKRADLGAQELRDGFAYFCTDDGTFHIDFLDTDGTVKRKQINAKDAETLLGHSIEEFLTASEDGSFAHGEGAAATGTNSYAGGQEVLAFGNAAHAEGYKTLAGGKGFKIIGFEDNGNGTGKYTLSSVTGLETEMRYSAVLSSANYNAGKIIEIVGNVVTVDGYKDIEFNSNADNADEFNVYNFLTIVDRPDLGDREVGFNAHTEGENTIASNKATHAEGRNTKAIGKFAHAEGSNTIAGHGAHAEGSGSQALGDISHAEGNRTKATGNYSHTEGNNTVASAQGTHAEGIKAQAIYNAAHAEGQNTLANGLAAHAEGESTIAKFTGSHAEGVSTQAIEEAAHAEGYNTQATAKAAHAEGENTVASAKRAHAEGYSTSASELNAHAEGKLTTASAEEAHAEGISTIASGAYSHTEGNTTQALSEAAHAEGKETIAQGIGAHAEGSKSRALNNTAHAEGSNTEASGEKSHSEGNSTKATGTASHAEGDKTEAKGYASHAGGQNSIASNAGSFVHGTGLKTNSNNQFVVGAYNKTFNEAGAAAFIVGNGKESARSNALAVMKNGDAYLKGDLYVGGLPEGDEGAGIAKVATEDEAHLYAETVANNAAEQVKNDLLNGAGEAYDTLKELADLIDENTDALEALYEVANNKSDKDHVHGKDVIVSADNQFVVGQYNKEDPDALFIVGGGEGEEDRKNLFTVKKDGSIIGLNTSNALTKTVSGGAISATDVSPIEHEMDVQVRGKNLLNLNNPYVTSGGEMTIDGTAITLTKKATGNPPSIIFELGAYKDFVGKTLTISFVLDAMGSSGGTNGNAAMAIHCGNTAKEAVESVNSISYSSGRVGETITKTFTVPVLDDKGRQLCIRHYMSKGMTEGDYITISNLQIEEGTIATAYAPYIEDISTVKVKKCGKNLIDISKAVNGNLVQNENGTYTITKNGGNRFSAKVPVFIPKGCKFGVTPINPVDNAPVDSLCFQLHLDGASAQTYNMKIGGDVVTTRPAVGNANVVGITFYLNNGEADGANYSFSDLQIEFGEVFTGLEPYIEPIEYPVSADGTVEGVTPIYPTTTLMTDTAGAVIDCTYNRDINRVLDDTGFMYDHNPSGTGSFSMNRKAGSEIGEYSHAEGYSSAAIGKASHAGGEATQAKGVGSFAHGQRVTADADYQATFGTHNEVNANAAFIVGNGSSSAKSNAFEVQKDGNAFVRGGLYIGGTGSTQASAKQVATKDSLSAMEQRINNLEDITSSTGGVFFEDADVAYVKTIPENIAPYASLNKVGGLGIYKKKLVNLIPSTYETANGSGDGCHTFSSDSEGVITIIDRTPVEEWTYEPWFSAEIPLNTIELPAGTYTAAIYADNPEGSPFGLNIYSGEDIRVGGAWGYDYSEQPGNPVTFVLTETTSLNLSLKFECGGSLWVPTGDTEVCKFRVMLNEGDEALPWEPYPGAEVKYIEPAKTTSVDIIGKNLFDYGTSRTIHTGEPGYAETNMMITDKGTAYIENLYISVEVGPGSEYGTIMSAWIDNVNSTITYPAGVYSVGDPVPHTNGEAYLVIYAKTINTQQNITIQGNNNVIAEPFTIRNASIDYAPAELTSGIYGIEVPLMLVKGTQTPVEPLPFKRSTIQIPSQIVSREDYGLGVYDTYNYELYNNYIDFERQKYIKRCLTQDLVGEVTGFGTNGTKINPGVMYSTICCSDPSITFEFYQPGPGAYELRAYKEGWDSSMVNEYIQNAMEAGTPLKVFFGTNLTEEIDISAELAGIDNYISVEAGGLIYFNNDRQEAVPSTIEYQSMMKKGEIEEL